MPENSNGIVSLTGKILLGIVIALVALNSCVRVGNAQGDRGIVIEWIQQVIRR